MIISWVEIIFIGFVRNPLFNSHRPKTIDNSRIRDKPRILPPYNYVFVGSTHLVMAQITWPSCPYIYWPMFLVERLLQNAVYTLCPYSWEKIDCRYFVWSSTLRLCFSILYVTTPFSLFWHLSPTFAVSLQLTLFACFSLLHYLLYDSLLLVFVWPLWGWFHYGSVWEFFALVRLGFALWFWVMNLSLVNFPISTLVVLIGKYLSCNYSDHFFLAFQLSFPNLCCLVNQWKVHLTPR